MPKYQEMGPDTSNLDTVSTGMIPGSLAVSTSLNPCANSNGFFDCQPNLLKLYLAIAKQMVSSIKEVTSGAASFINNQEDGASGEVTVNDGGLTKLVYNITDGTKYSFILFSASGAFMYIDLVTTDSVPTYTIKFDVSKMPEDDESEGDDGGPSLAEASVTYTSETEYVVDMKMVGTTCNSDDVRSPQNFHIKISRAGSAWKGSANLYMPRWLYAGTPTCDLTPSADTKLFMYHDFVGDATSSTAKLYMASSSLTAKTDFPTWHIENFCSNYSTLCSGGKSLGDQNVIATTYINPFCVKASGSTWNGACTEQPVTGLTGETGLDLPSELDSLTITIPTTLD